MEHKFLLNKILVYFLKSDYDNNQYLGQMFVYRRITKRKVFSWRPPLQPLVVNSPFAPTQLEHLDVELV